MSVSPSVFALCLATLIIGLIALIPTLWLILLKKQRYRKHILPHREISDSKRI